MSEDRDDTLGLFEQIAGEHLIQRPARAGRPQSGSRTARPLGRRTPTRFRPVVDARRAGAEVWA